MIITLEKYMDIEKEIEIKGKLFELKQNRSKWGSEEMGEATRGVGSVKCTLDVK